MSITRRSFLKSFGPGCAAIACGDPINAIAYPTKEKITVDAYVDKIEGDKLSESFYKNSRHGLWVPIAGGVKRIYSPHFDVEVNLKDGEVDRNGLGANHLALQYSRREALIKDPKRLVRYLLGDAKEFDRAIEKDILTMQKTREIDYTRAEKLVLQKVGEAIMPVLKEKGILMDDVCGEYSKKSKDIFVFHSDTFNMAPTDEQFCNAYAFVASHEIGHALSLEESKWEDLREGEPHDVMCTKQNLRDIFLLNFALRPSQIKQIRQHLVKA
jgi:hypothetical protein